MNDKDYTDILNRHGVPVPPSWGGMIGSGSEQMFSLGGRWLKVGQRSPQGHTIDSLDPKTGYLNISYQGVPLMPLKMRDSVVQDYVPEFTRQFNTPKEYGQYEIPDSMVGTEYEKDVEKLKALGASDEQIFQVMHPNTQSMKQIDAMYKRAKETGSRDYLEKEMQAIQFPKFQFTGFDVQGKGNLPEQSYIEDPVVQLFGNDGLIK